MFSKNEMQHTLNAFYFCTIFFFQAAFSTHCRSSKFHRCIIFEIISNVSGFAQTYKLQQYV